MSTISNERDQELSAEIELVEEELVEVGKASETKGSPFGVTNDVGNGLRGA